MAALRAIIVVATATVVTGCTVTVSPPAPSAAPPTTASTSVPPTTTTAATARSTTRATQTAPVVKLSAFAGTWSGHDRSLTVSASGRGHETVYDGCCTPQVDLTFQLSNPRGAGAAHASATATVTAVALYAESGAAPKVGQRGTVSLVDGVFTDSLGSTFCNEAAAARSVCGA